MANPLRNDRVMVELDPLEHDLIQRLRTKYRFGEITIVMHGGRPQRIKRVTEYEALGGDIHT